jgi:hypothetical protein
MAERKAQAAMALAAGQPEPVAQPLRHYFVSTGRWSACLELAMVALRDNDQVALAEAARYYRAHLLVVPTGRVPETTWQTLALCADVLADACGQRPPLALAAPA